MVNADEEHLAIAITGLAEWKITEKDQIGRGLILKTSRGDIQVIVHHDPSKPTTKGIVWVGGASGGLNGPNSLYKILGDSFSPEITSLRVNYRHPGELIESVMDTLAAVSFLVGTGHQELVLVGHSFGGAVVIKSASFSDQVKSVIALASQTHGATEASLISPRSLFLIHGNEDTILDPQCSRTIFEWAKEPKQIEFIKGAGHSFKESKQELQDKVEIWITRELN
jgi:alpha/beta superfamily hydrolase